MSFSEMGPRQLYRSVSSGERLRERGDALGARSLVRLVLGSVLVLGEIISLSLLEDLGDASSTCGTASVAVSAGEEDEDEQKVCPQLVTIPPASPSTNGSMQMGQSSSSTVASLSCSHVHQ
jgi:hypothetical protein